MVFSLLRRRMRCMVTGCAIAVAFCVATDSTAAGRSCETLSFEDLVKKSQVDLSMGLARTAASGILLIAARGQKPMVLVGTAVLTALEVPALAKAFSDARQVFGLPTVDPKQPVEVCPADDALAKALNFKHLTIVAPSGLGKRIDPGLAPQPVKPPANGLPSGKMPPFKPLFPDTSLKQLMKEIDGLKEAPKTIDAFPQRSPAPTPSLPPPDPAPRTIEPRAPNRPAAVFTGVVLDARSKHPVRNATVQVTVLTGPAEGHWWKSSTSNDGTFDLRVPGEKYKLWIKVPDYDPFSSTISLQEGSHQNLTVLLTRRTPYPCDYTVFNKTGWKITLYFDNGAPPEYVLPWLSRSFLLQRPVGISPAAEFSDRPPMRWGKVAGRCGGAAYVNLLP